MRLGWLERLRSGRGFRASGFEAGSRTLTRVRNWTPPLNEINDALFADGELMRARSRKLVQENAWAGGAVDTFAANAIGTGIRPRSLHPDPARAQLINQAFERWTADADAAGQVDFYGLQTLACRTIRTDGEAFTRIRYRYPTDGLYVPLQLQVFEADLCPYSKTEMLEAAYSRGGIRFDATGRRTGYWLYRDHPASSFQRDTNLYLVSADLVIHTFEVRRPGQIRGAPWLTPAIVMLYDIKQLTDAALMRLKVANLLSIFIRKSANATPLAGETDQGDGTSVAGLTPGSVNYLMEGEEPTFLEPDEPGVSFKEFINALLRAVARALGLTFEQLSGDLSGVNYSSIRAGLLEFRRWCEAWQHQVIVHQFCTPVWKVWMEQAILAGVLGEGAASDYAKDPTPFLAVRWDPPGWPWVDPQKDVLAHKEAVRSGFTSRQAVVAETGEDAAEIDRQQAEDAARADELGLKYDSDGRHAASATQQNGPDGKFGPAPAPEPEPAADEAKED